MTKADHDHAYKVLFAHPRMVRDLLRGFIGGHWLSEVDFDSLERAESAHTSDDLRERRDDIVWRLRWRGRWLYLLVEFQSVVEPFMTVRVLTYVGLLYQDLIRAKQIPAGRSLPPVLPVVIYNGTSRWHAPEDLALLLYETPHEIAGFQQKSRYWLIDEGGYDERELAEEHNLVAMLFGLERARSRKRFRRLVHQLAIELQGAEQDSLRRAFAVWLDRGRAARPQVDITASLTHLLENPGMLSEFFERERQKNERKGEARLLARQLRKRFGELPKPIEARLRRANTDQLELWAEQLLDATSLRELFTAERNA